MACAVCGDKRFLAFLQECADCHRYVCFACKKWRAAGMQPLPVCVQCYETAPPAVSHS